MRACPFLYIQRRGKGTPVQDSLSHQIALLGWCMQDQPYVAAAFNRYLEELGKNGDGRTKEAGWIWQYLTKTLRSVLNPKP